MPLTLFGNGLVICRVVRTTGAGLCSSGNRKMQAARFCQERPEFDRFQVHAVRDFVAIERKLIGVR
jgi:hypothetical protein